MALSIVRRLDLVVLALTLPVFVAADFPLPGWITGAGCWVGQRLIRHLTEHRAAASEDPRTIVGLTAGSLIGRGWLVALTIFAVGAAVDEDAGLAAAVLFISVFTVYFTVNLILRPFEKEGRP